jgi:ABC-type lipoprotein export system ATPase subunit
VNEMIALNVNNRDSTFGKGDLEMDFVKSNNLFFKVEGLHKTYGAVEAVRGVDFFIQQNEFLSIVGRSGSGKSTLLYLLAGLEAPDRGHIYCYSSDCQGVDIVQRTEDELAVWRRSQVGLVFQAFNLIPTLSAAENVAFPLYPEKISSHERRARAMECLQLVGLAHRATHRPTQLSGGEQQRVAIARALIAKPGLILADEPTGNLDSQTSQEIIDLFKELHARSGVAMVVITHDDKVAAAAERILHMKDGRIIE